VIFPIDQSLGLVMSEAGNPDATCSTTATSAST